MGGLGNSGGQGLWAIEPPLVPTHRFGSLTLRVSLNHQCH